MRQKIIEDLTAEVTRRSQGKRGREAWAVEQIGLRQARLQRLRRVADPVTDRVLEIAEEAVITFEVDPVTGAVTPDATPGPWQAQEWVEWVTYRKNDGTILQTCGGRAEAMEYEETTLDPRLGIRLLRRTEDRARATRQQFVDVDDPALPLVDDPEKIALLPEDDRRGRRALTAPVAPWWDSMPLRQRG